MFKQCLSYPRIHNFSHYKSMEQSKDQTVFKLSQDPDFVDGRTIGRTDTRTEGKPKVPSAETPVGD